VGLLVGGWDKDAGHLYYNCPSGNYYEYKAFAVGARSQAAKTYLERHFESFPSCSLDQLIQHALKSLQASMSDGELKREAVTVSVVGRGMAFTILEDDVLDSAIAAVNEADGSGDGEAGGGDAAAAPAAAAQPAAADEPAAGGNGAAPGDDERGAAPMET
jgi:20S proteasome subunit alpha 6